MNLDAAGTSSLNEWLGDGSLKEALRTFQIVLIAAATGQGKTTGALFELVEPGYKVDSALADAGFISEQVVKQPNGTLQAFCNAKVATWV